MLADDISSPGRSPTANPGICDISEISEISEIEYLLIVAEFDSLWRCSLPPDVAGRARMDQLICLIEAFEASRGKASFN